MIGIDGQYVFKFSLNNETDFINEEDLIKFTLIEKAGGTLPEFEFQFLSYDDALLSKLNETSKLLVSYGKDVRELADTSLSIQALESTRRGDDRRQIALVGYYSALKYLNQTNSFFSENKSGVEVMRDIVAKHFIPDFNIEVSDDSQVWIQPNQTDKAFIRELWMHSYLTKSFPAIGITSDGRFLLRDVAKTFKEDFVYKFTNTALSEEDNAIPYDGDYSIKVQRGFINNWVGYDRERLTFKYEDGSQSLVKETIEPLLSLTQNFAKNAEIERRFQSNAILNQNMHSNYWKAANKNLAHLVQFGDTKITLTFTNIFAPIKILDLVMFKDDQVGSGRNQVADAHSGLYLVSKVARNYENSQFTTVVELSRESMNEIKGESVSQVIDAEQALIEANQAAAEISTEAATEATEANGGT